MQAIEIPATSVRQPGISLTPLIDVVFILLIFFMLVVQFKVLQQTPLATVQSTHAPVAHNDNALIVTLGADGRCGYRERADDCADVVAELETGAGDTVFLAFEPDVPLQMIVSLQDKMIQHGLTVSLALPEEGDAP